MSGRKIMLAILALALMLGLLAALKAIPGPRRATGSVRPFHAGSAPPACRRPAWARKAAREGLAKPIQPSDDLRDPWPAPPGPASQPPWLRPKSGNCGRSGGSRIALETGLCRPFSHLLTH